MIKMKTSKSLVSFFWCLQYRKSVYETLITLLQQIQHRNAINNNILGHIMLRIVSNLNVKMYTLPVLPVKNMKT